MFLHIFIKPVSKLQWNSFVPLQNCVLTHSTRALQQSEYFIQYLLSFPEIKTGIILVAISNNKAVFSPLKDVKQSISY